MTFADMGRMVLEIQITDSLKGHAGEFDTPGIVEEFVEKYGFVDVEEVGNEEYWNLVMRHDRSAAKAPEKSSD